MRADGYCHAAATYVIPNMRMQGYCFIAILHYTAFMIDDLPQFMVLVEKIFA